MIRIAIVEKNPSLLEYFTVNLQQADYEVMPMPKSEALDAWLLKSKAGLLLLDCYSPCEGELSTVADMRRVNPRLGIVMLVNYRCTYENRVRFLEKGVDACLTMPVDIRELQAVIRAVARRIDRSEDSRLNDNKLQAWTLDASQLELIAPDGKRVTLSPNEFCVLQAAARAKGNLLNRKTLIEALGKNYLHYDERCLETLISRLRRKLASTVKEGFPLRGVRGHGYLFGAELQEIQEIREKA